MSRPPCRTSAGLGQGIGMWKGSTISDSRQLSSVSPYVRVFLLSSPQHLGRNVPPSTRPKIRRYTAENLVGHNKEGFGSISGGVRYDRTPCIGF